MNLVEQSKQVVQEARAHEKKKIDDAFYKFLKDNTYSSEKVKEMSEVIYFSRERIINCVSKNKKSYPILKMPEYIYNFYNLSTLSIAYSNAPRPPQEPKKPLSPVFNSNVNVPDGVYTYENQISIFKVLGFIVILLPLFSSIPTIIILSILESLLGQNHPIMRPLSIIICLACMIGVSFWFFKSTGADLYSDKQVEAFKYYTEAEKEEIKNKLIREEEIKHKQRLQQHESDLNKYEEDIVKYNKEIEKFDIDFEKWKQYMNKNYLEWLDKEFFNTIKMNKSSNFQRIKNPREGSSEGIFFVELYEKFKNEIKIDTALDYYYPDIAIVINNSIIDIEIDEPYTLNEKKEIHYIDDKGIHVDTERDKFFLSKNWFVLRFSEEQVVKHTNTCVKLIELISEFIKTENFCYLSDYIELSESIEQEQWTYEDARYMAKNDSRMKE